MFMGCGTCQTCGNRRLEEGLGENIDTTSNSSSVEEPSDSWHSGRAKKSFNTWTDYTEDEQVFESLNVNKPQLRSTPSPINYYAVVRDMNYILTSLANSLYDANSTDTSKDALCFLGAKLVAS